MAELRLGAIDLAPRDTAYVRALVRLFAHTEQLDWSFTDTAPYHAVVAKAGAQAANPGFFATFGGLVLTLGGVAMSDNLAYPIRANQFRDWLKLRQDSAHAPAAPAAPLAPAASALPGRRYKLRRWPSAALLRDPAAMRMATFLSRNALDVAQLAALTARSEEACLAFLGVLHAAGLLVEVAAPAAAAPPAGNVDTGGAPAAAGGPPARRGLVASLRRHLGI